MIGREIRLAAFPAGEPRKSDFSLAETEVGEPAPGQVLVRNTWMSLDPAMRLRMDPDGPYVPKYEEGATLDGAAVGVVVASRADGFAEGDHILHRYGWRDYALVSPEGNVWGAPERIETADGTPERTYLGPLGSVGLTPYVGLRDVAELRDGDVVFVSGAAGAVGGLAVQIAKILGHTVVGSAGTPQKVAHVRDVLGADAAFCYRDGPVRELLRDAAPDGIDVYFDNVGADHLEAGIDALRPGGRIAMCGAIATYDADSPQPGPSNLFQLITKGATLRGFLARQYAHRFAAFREEMRRWLADGLVVYPEHIVEGLERAPDAFIGMLRGTNTGKTLVKIS